MAKYTDEMWLKVFEKWLKENPGKTINSIKLDEIIIFNGANVNIGLKLSKMRTGKNLLDAKTMKILKEKYKFKSSSDERELGERMKKEQQWFEILDKWLKNNPGKTINDIKTSDVIEENGKKYQLGDKISCIRRGVSPFSKENMEKLYNEYGFIQEIKQTKFPDELWMQAIDKWLGENPDKNANDIPSETVVKIGENEMKIGAKISQMRGGRNLLDSNNMKKLEEKGFEQKIKLTLHTEDEYFIMIDKWLKENPEKTINDIPTSEVVLYNGEEAKLGYRLMEVRLGSKKPSEAGMKKFKEIYHLDFSPKRTSDEDYITALDEWLKLNKGKTINDLTKEDAVILNDKIIHIGRKMINLRLGYGKLGQESMKKLTELYGFTFSNKNKQIKKKKKELLIEAIKKWLEENPGKSLTDVKYDEIYEISGEKVRLGTRLSEIRVGKCKLDDQSMKYLEENGLVLEAKTTFISDEIWLKAIEKWLKENPDKTINDISDNEEEEMDDEIYKIGTKISYIRRGKSGKSILNLLIEKYGFINKIKKEAKISDEVWLKAIDKWLEKNKGKTINDINTSEKIDIDGESISIGYKINDILRGKSLMSEDTMKKLHNQYSLNYEAKKTTIKNKSDDLYMKAFKEWLRLNPSKTLDDVKAKTSIMIDGQDVQIGSKLVHMRKEKSLLDEKYMNELVNELGFKIIKKLNKTKIPSKKIYLDAIDKWLKNNPGKNVNNIPVDEIVNVGGIDIKIGMKLSKMRGGKNLLDEENMKILKEKYGFKTREELDNENGFVREIEPLKKEIDSIVKEKSFEKYLDEYDGNEELAKEKDKKVKEIEKVIKEERKNKKSEITLDELKKEFNVNEEELDKYLSQIKSDTERSEVLYIDENETLRNYCIRKGYNYTVIYNLICKSKEYNVSFKQIIQEYLENGQSLPIRYVYDKNEVLVKHILLGINVDSKSVIEDMKHSYTLSEAIAKDVFRRNVLDKKDKWLELPYTFLIEELGPFSSKSNTKIKFKDFENLLSKKEQVKLMSLYDTCSKTLRGYQYLEVGLEKDINKVKELIKKYSLTDDEITKASLKAMEYENGIKLTKNDVRSERLKNIKPIIISWNNLNEEAKNKLIKAYALTNDELEMIKSYNEKIEYNIKLYKELLKENNITDDEIKTLKEYHKNLYYNMNLYK